MDKMWAGRFGKALDKEADDFNSSIHFDSKMYVQDIKGSIAHASMLVKQGIISTEDYEEITDGLSSICDDITSGALPVDMEAEDIHTFIEGELTKRLDSTGKRLHTARSRNDQVALDIRMYLKEEISDIIHSCIKEILIEKIIDKGIYELTITFIDNTFEMVRINSYKKTAWYSLTGEHIQFTLFDRVRYSCKGNTKKSFVI